MKKKVLIFSENLKKPFDEGIKKTAWTILKELSKLANVKGICRYGDNSNNPPLKVLNSNRLLLNANLWKEIKNFSPQIILYIPTSSGTFASYLRMKVMSIYGHDAKTVMIEMQPKRKTEVQKRILKYLKPDMVLSPSLEVIEDLKELNIPSEFIPLGVDSEKFKPLKNESEKFELRKKYSLPLDKYIILHVGHINWGRNLGALLHLQENDYQVVIVASTSTPQDAPKDEVLKKKLEEKGLIIIDEYLEYIHELYQLSDVYVFPVVYEGGSIGIPLSVMEARACGIPVISTDFGGLKFVFKDKTDGIFFCEPDKFPRYVNLLKSDKTNKCYASFKFKNNFLPSLKKNLGLNE